MTIKANSPHQPEGNKSRASVPNDAATYPDAPGLSLPTAERNLQACSNDRVYQAAGDQYIYNRSSPAAVTASNTLPRDTAAFTGREGELRALLRAAAPADKTRMVPVHAIDGMPGIGKSALAIHAGHLLGHQFPDGQIFIDLHAHTAGQGPVRPADALYALLAADGVDASQIPADVDSRAAQWRRRMAGKRALIILDNAAGRWQVEHLLPGAAGCLVLITSRRRLTGIGAYHAAESIPLGTLSPMHAATLFTAMAAREVTGAEADAVNELVRLCGFLPLAICLLAAKLRPEPHWRVADLVRELRQAKHRLTQMQAEDVAVAAAFDLSYCRLSAGQRRFFRRLGLHPGADLDPYAAAALDGISPAKAQRQLDSLYHDHLLDQPVRNRYRMHDLIGEYARSRADGDAEGARALATNRMLDYYQHCAQTADQFLSRPGRRRSSTPVGVSAARPTISTCHEALAWMVTERANLFACATLLSARPGDLRLVALATALSSYMRQTGPWEHAIALHQAALGAAQEADDRHAQADTLLELGTVRRLTGDYGSATHILCQALDLYRQLDHSRGAADTLTQLAGVRWRAGDHRGAARELQQALAIHQALGDLHGQADALDELGVVRHLADDPHAAIHTLDQALAIHRQTGDLRGQANTLSQLGTVQELSGEYPTAIQDHERALAIYRDLGDRHGQARALNYLGAALCQIGDYPTAEHTLTQALAVHQDLGYRLGQANALQYLGSVHCQTGVYPAAEQTLILALALYRELAQQLGQANTLNQLGVLRRLTGDFRAAAEAHEQALVIYQQIGDHLGQAEVLNRLGQLLLARGQPSDASEHYGRALVLARKAQSPREEADAIEGAGRCAMHLGNRRDATEKLRQAQGIYQRIGALHAAGATAELLNETPTARGD
jgi:tetratricopeptide (TPR) repeat protein